MSSLEGLENILHNHVKVVTKIKKSRDFDSSFPYDLQTRNLVFIGYLKAFDPITKSVVMCTVEDNIITENLLILGHLIDRIELYERSDTVSTQDIQRLVFEDTEQRLSKHPYFERKKVITLLTAEEVTKKRDEIVSWLTKLRIPNQVNAKNNDIIIADDVRIKVPYEHISDYICPTRIVLKRIHHIVESRYESASYD